MDTDSIAMFSFTKIRDIYQPQTYLFKAKDACRRIPPTYPQILICGPTYPRALYEICAIINAICCCTLGHKNGKQDGGTMHDRPDVRLYVRETESATCQFPIFFDPAFSNMLTVTNLNGVLLNLRPDRVTILRESRVAAKQKRRMTIQDRVGWKFWQEVFLNDRYSYRY